MLITLTLAAIALGAVALALRFHSMMLWWRREAHECLELARKGAYMADKVRQQRLAALAKAQEANARARAAKAGK